MKIMLKPALVVISMLCLLLCGCSECVRNADNDEEPLTIVTNENYGEVAP